jgi:integrase
MPDGVYKMLAGYAASIQINAEGFGPHALRATAATNALDHEADIAKVQEWLGHASIATTRSYDRRKMRPEDSPTFKVKYLVSRYGRRRKTPFSTLPTLQCLFSHEGGNHG